jgi:hypothetical protein
MLSSIISHERKCIYRSNNSYNKKFDLLINMVSYMKTIAYIELVWLGGQRVGKPTGAKM